MGQPGTADGDSRGEAGGEGEAQATALPHRAGNTAEALVTGQEAQKPTQTLTHSQAV